jgi:hypothetical protein
MVEMLNMYKYIVQRTCEDSDGLPGGSDKQSFENAANQTLLSLEYSGDNNGM